MEARGISRSELLLHRMCYANDVVAHQKGGTRGSQARRGPSPRALLTFALTAIAAMGLGVVLYFAATSIAWFASAPTTDARFGAINGCLMSHAPEGRAGFAVSHDGAAAATFNGAGLAICASSAGRTDGRFIPLPGVTRVAFDGAGNLWIATSGRGTEEAALWRLATLPDSPERVARETAVALLGHALGAVTLDGAGRLVSLSVLGDSRAFVEAPRVTQPRLSADASGELVALIGGGALRIYRAADLRPVLEEAPCEVEYVWWTPQPGKALLACGPNSSWALEIDAHTGARQEAPRRERTRSVLVPRLRAYVVSCDGLPCEAPPP